MAAVVFPFIGPSYTSQSSVADCEIAMNVYMEKLESQGAKSAYVMVRTPGFTLDSTMTNTPCRGMSSQDDRMFIVGGNTYYERSAIGTLTSRGTCAVDGFPSSTASNGLGGHQNFIVSGNRGDIFDLASNVYATGVLTGCRFAGFVDGYFLALDPATSTFKISALEDGLTWDPLDVAQRSTSGDKWVSMVVANGDVWLFGSQTTDVWQDTGDPLFPFAPIAGARIQFGTVAPFSCCVQDGVPHWLGGNQNGSAVWYSAEGYREKRVSNHAVEFAVQNYSDVSDAVAMTYQDIGHAHALMSFPSAGATWCFDATEGLFHQRGYWNSMRAQFEAYRPQFHTFCFGKHFVGDRASGAIYQMSSTVATEVDGTGIRAVRQVPVYAQTPNYVYFDRLEIDIESGLGLPTGQGSAPFGVLSYSDDGGKTFGNEHFAGLGALGRYAARVFWNLLGRAYGNRRVFRYVQTDPIPCRISQSFLFTSAGRS